MNTEKKIISAKVQWLEIDEECSGQRLDNFLIARLKGVPKSHIYRIVRKGEVRVNKGRKKVTYRLQTGDSVRLPPVTIAQREEEIFVPNVLKRTLEAAILFEDDSLIVLNKPSGFAVHGGTGINSGVIEALRYCRPDARFLELVHRLDKDTSGCLLIAKKRSALRNLHEMFRGTGIKKTYLALLAGQWTRKKLQVDAPLKKNASKGGERTVVVSPQGKEAHTFFRRVQLFKQATLVEASPKTGRTHQIRVHAATCLGHAIVGDSRYGEEAVNQHFKSRGFKRLFLHAQQLEFKHPLSEQLMSISAPLPQNLTDLLNHEQKI